MAIRYQRSVQGNSYDPLTAPDNSAQVEEQARAYIDSLKRRREQEALQQAAFVEGMRRKMAVETQSLQAYSQQSVDKFNTFAELEQKRDAVEARRKELANIAATGRPDPTEAVLKFVGEVVPQALQQYARIDEFRQKDLWEKGAQLGMILPSVETIAQASNLSNGQILSAESSSLAAQLEAAGVDPNIVDQVRSSNQYKMSGIRHSLAKGVGQSAYTQFQTELNNPETQYSVDIDGQEYALNQLPDQTSSTLSRAYMQFVPRLFGLNGFDDVSSEFLSEGLQTARADGDRAFGQMRLEEIKRNKLDILDQERQAFQIEVRDPNTSVGALQDIYTAEYQASLSHASANGKLKEYLSDPNIVPQNIFDDLEDNLQLPGRPKLYAQDRPADWAEIKEKRQQALNQKFNTVQTARRQTAEKEAIQLRQMIAKDLEGDQEFNISDEQYRDLYSRIQAEGVPNDPRLAVLDSNQKYTSSVVQQAEQLARFKELADKGGLTEGMVFRSSLDPEKKRDLYNRIKSGTITSIDKETNRRAKQYIRDRILERTGDGGYIPNTSDTKGYVNRAVDFALQKFQRDYVNFARSTDTKGDPYTSAIGLFEAEMSNESGIYQVYTDEDILNGADAKLKGTFKNNSFKIQPNLETVQSPEALVADAFQKYGDKVINTPNIIPRKILTDINDDIVLGRRGVIPPVIEIIADRYNTDPLTVLEQQFKVNDIDYDENYFKPAKEAVQSINPVWRTYLNNRPQVETTDAALIDSGQSAVYQIMPPLGQQVRAIVMKRESPIEGYNAMNNGQGGDRPGGARRHLGKDFKDMTLNEVLAFQQNGSLWAAGAYQFVPNTLPEAMQLAGVTGDMKFTPEVQDALFWATFDVYGASKWNPYWSNPATQQELEIMERFRQQYDYTKPTWRQSNNMNPNLRYRMGMTNG